MTRRLTYISSWISCQPTTFRLDAWETWDAVLRLVVTRTAAIPRSLFRLHHRPLCWWLSLLLYMVLHKKLNTNSGSLWSLKIGCSLLIRRIVNSAEPWAEEEMRFFLLQPEYVAYYTDSSTFTSSRGNNPVPLNSSLGVAMCRDALPVWCEWGRQWFLLLQKLRWDIFPTDSSVERIWKIQRKDCFPVIVIDVV